MPARPTSRNPDGDDLASPSASARPDESQIPVETTAQPPTHAVQVESDDGDFLFVDQPEDTPKTDDDSAWTAAPESVDDAPISPTIDAAITPDAGEPEIPAEPHAEAPTIDAPPPPPPPPIIGTASASAPSILPTLTPIPPDETQEAPPAAPRMGKDGNVSSRPPDLLALLRRAPATVNEAAPPPPAPALKPVGTPILATPLHAFPIAPGETPPAPRLLPPAIDASEIPPPDITSARPIPPAPIALSPLPIPGPPSPPPVPVSGTGGNASSRPPDILALARATAEAGPPAPPEAPRLLPVGTVPPPALPSQPDNKTAEIRLPAPPRIIANSPAPVPFVRHFPVREITPRRSVIRWLSAMGDRPVRPAPADSGHAHLTERTRRDERFSRALTLSGAAIILPALLLGWRHLVPDNAQMLDRLVADGRLKEAATLANRMAETDTRKNGPDYRFLATAMLVENAATGDTTSRKLAFARTLDFARKNPGDAFLASAAISAMRKLGESTGATDFFAENCAGMPAHLVTLWVEGLVERHLAANNPGEALRVTMIGWDTSPGQAVTPEFLLRIAKLAGKPDVINSRIRQYVVVGGRFDKADLYRESARASGNESEALGTLWPFMMMRLKQSDYADLSRSIMACGPTALPKETESLVQAALNAEDLAFDSGTAVIRLCLSRGMTAQADAMVDKLAARRCETPEFLRLASDCKLWSNRPDLALEFLSRAYFRTGDEADFRRCVALASTQQSTRDIVALCEHRGMDKLSAADLPLYAAALTAMGEYESALRAYAKLRVAAGRDDIGTLRSIARLQRALHRDDEALATYGILVKTEPDKAEWRDQEFRLLVTLGRETEAIAAAERNWRQLRNPRYIGEALTAATAADDRTAILRIALEAENAAATADPVHLLDACYYLQLAKKNEPRMRILAVLSGRFPDRADIAMELVAHDYDNGRYDAVEKRFRQLPVLATNRDGAALRLSARLESDDKPAAEALLDDALKSHDAWLDNPAFAAMSTEAAIRLNRTDAIDTLAERFLAKADGAGTAAFTTLATRLLTAQGKAAEALPLYRRLGEEMDANLRMDYAWALASTGNYGEAEIQMERAIAENNKPTARLFGALGDLRLSAGAGEPAREAYRKALRLLETKS